MNFFEAQERARKRTGRLVLLFCVAVLGTILACYGAAVVLFGGAMEQEGVTGFWQPGLFAGTSATILGIVGLATLYKWSELRGGGPTVAEMMGGRKVAAGRASTAERRLLNVVEEMAIASGVPVPGVYILDEEEGINAFAAGLGSEDAVIAVTRGTLDRLTRDELQGVVAHEFSHILNGDMRLNLRLTAVLFGILVLGLLGQGMLRLLGQGRIRSGGKEKNGGIVLLIAIGVALMVIGYVGYFFGRLIQAGVSRQREFLADASSVQFTRNPGGITGALRKIGGFPLSSRMQASHAGEFRHLFFADGATSWFGSMLSTHPAIEERIRAVDPAWDGQLLNPARQPEEENEQARPAGRQGSGPRPSPQQQQLTNQAPAGTPPLLPPPVPLTAGFSGGQQGAPAQGARLPYVAAQVVDRAGSLTEEHFEQARNTLGRIPLALRRAAENPAAAPSLVAALLQHGQVPHSGPVQAPLNQAHYAELQPLCSGLPADLRLPLIQITLPSLHDLQPAERSAFLSQLTSFAAADGSTSAFEFSVLAMVSRCLTGRPAGGGASGGIFSFTAVEGDLRVLLSALAWCGSSDEKAAARALATGYSQLKIVEEGARLLPEAECNAERLAAALTRLSQGSLPIRRRFLMAASHVIGSDGTVTLEEAELLRAMAMAVDCPLPLWDGAPATG